MSAVVSSVIASGCRAGPAPTFKKSSSAAKRSVKMGASLGDKFREFKDKLPKGPDVSMPNFGGEDQSASGPEAGVGYEPVSGEEFYVGKGKYIPDNKGGFVSKTGRDSQLVGGFAGGEKGLWQYRDILSTDSRLTPEKAVFKEYGARKGSDEVSLAKDFGGMAGGFPGGEIGVKAFNATGEIATRDAPPTIGWGPPVLLLAAIGGAGYYLNPGDPNEELGAAVNAAAGAKAAVDGVLTPEQELLLAQIGGAGVGIVLAGAALRAAAKKAGQALDGAVRVGLLGAATLAIAGKVLDLY